MPSKATSKPQQISASQLAAEMLEMRLKVVRTNMKSVVARWKKDPEHLHELRISLRRVIASLDLFAPCCHPVKDVQWLGRKLKAVLKSTSKARDLDVLLSRPLPKSGKAGSQIRKTWVNDRKKAQKPLQRHYAKLIEEKKLRQHSQSLLKSTRKSDTSSNIPVDPYAWSMLQLHNRLQSLLKGIPAKPDSQALHKFRIAAKQLRYTAEIVAEITADSCVTDLLEQLTPIQKQLGRLQDETVAAKSLARAGEKSDKSKSKKSTLVNQSEACQKNGIRLSEELSTWLKGEVQPALQKLSTYLAPPATRSESPVDLPRRQKKVRRQ
jgi:CHAD domain-containing protein